MIDSQPMNAAACELACVACSRHVAGSLQATFLACKQLFLLGFSAVHVYASQMYTQAMRTGGAASTGVSIDIVKES
jgi:hypothetical protein